MNQEPGEHDRFLYRVKEVSSKKLFRDQETEKSRYWGACSPLGGVSYRRREPVSVGIMGSFRRRRKSRLGFLGCRLLIPVPQFRDLIGI